MGDNSDFASGYSLGRSEGSCSNGGFGSMWGDGIWAIIILTMLGFGGGWGGFGGFGGGGFVNGALTRAELYDGFAMQNIDSAVRGVQQGICDSTYALKDTITNGFHGVDRAVCDLGYQQKDCCCETQRLIERGFCDIGGAVKDMGRDLADNSNCNFRALNDTIRDGFARIEAADNARYTAELERKLNACDRDGALRDLGVYLVNTLRPAPVPAYPTCNPWAASYGWNGYGGCGQGYGGCGCGC